VQFAIRQDRAPVRYAFSGAATTAPECASSSGPSSFCWLLNDGRRLPLRTGENILGRDDDAIQIDSPTVSRRHARIVITGAEALLEDLGSKNGMFVQGAPVSAPVRLADGDEIRTGSVVLRFRMILPKGATTTWSGEGRRDAVIVATPLSSSARP